MGICESSAVARRLVGHSIWVAALLMAATVTGLGASAQVQGIIETVAGGRLPSRQAQNEVFSPISVAADPAGNLYLTDFNTSSVYERTVAGGIVRVAGNGIAGFGGDNGPATQAMLSSSLAVAVDSAGNLFVADGNNSLIRRVDARTHIITTVAGDGNPGFGGDGGPATSAELRFPGGIAVDSGGRLFISDSGNCLIREVNTAGVISTVAGVTAGAGTGSNCGFSGDGGPATSAALNATGGLKVDSTGRLFISDSGNCVVRLVDAGGTITTVAGKAAGAGTGSNCGFGGDRGSATKAKLNFPSGVAIDGDGNLFIADAHNERVRFVAHSTGTISTIAGTGKDGFGGDGDEAVEAILSFPSDVVLDQNGDVFIADLGNGRIRRIGVHTSNITTVAGGGRGGDGGPARDAEIGFSQSFVNGLAVNSAGVVFIGDNNNNRIRRLDVARGTITSVAGSPTGALGFTGDGGLAKHARMGFPGDLAADAAGNLFIEDFENARIRRVDAATGVIESVAGNGTSGFSGDGGPATRAQLGFPEGVGADPAGNIFIPDTGNQRVRRVDAVTGIIDTVAGNGIPGFMGDGGPATSAQLSSPFGSTADRDGNLFIADSGNNRIREVSAATGIIQTVAGSDNPNCGFGGDGGPATAAQLCFPERVAVDQYGNIFIADTFNQRIRRVDQANGIITTVAGNGAAGFSGDGGSATDAELNVPEGLAIDASGDLFIADSGNARVRKVVFPPPRAAANTRH
jgi:sugar lactone lactonase YvrE